MKKFLLKCVVVLLLTSCSKDGENSSMEQQTAIIGTWNLVEIQYATATASSELEFASGIVDLLVLQNCEIVTFVFNADKTLVVENSTSYIEIDLTAAGTGLSINCPTQSDTENSTWSLNGSQLTFVDGDGAEETVAIQLNGDTLIVPAENLNAENFEAGDAVFKRM